MPTPLSAEIQQLIDRSNFAHLATLKLPFARTPPQG